MITLLKMLVLAVCFATMVGCSTTTSFMLPKDTQVRIDDRDETFKSGKAEMRPFFWNAFDGVNFSIVKNGKTVRKGKLPAEFRVVSIFWPPYAFIYWPMGLKYTCYDLTDSDEVKHCDSEDQSNMIQTQPVAQPVPQPVAESIAESVAKPAVQPLETKSEPTVAPQSITSSSASMVVIVNKAKLRKKASTKADVVKTLKKGEEVQVIKQKDEWSLIELAGGEIGWCLKGSLAQRN